MRRLVVLTLLLAGVASAQNTPVQACTQVSQCPGPKIGNLPFSLLANRQASVAAAAERWGDYIKVELVLSNLQGSDLVFNPRSVSLITSTGQRLQSVQPAQLTEQGGRFFGIGSAGGPGPDVGPPPPDEGSVPTQPQPQPPTRPLPTSDTARAVLDPDPLGRLQAQRERRRLHNDDKQLRWMLRHQLVGGQIGGDQTIAGFVLVQRPAGPAHPAYTELQLGNMRFRLPLK